MIFLKTRFNSTCKLWMEHIFLEYFKECIFTYLAFFFVLKTPMACPKAFESVLGGVPRISCKSHIYVHWTTGTSDSWYSPIISHWWCQCLQVVVFRPTCRKQRLLCWRSSISFYSFWIFLFCAWQFCIVNVLLPFKVASAIFAFLMETLVMAMFSKKHHPCLSIQGKVPVVLGKQRCRWRVPWNSWFQVRNFCWSWFLLDGSEIPTTNKKPPFWMGC